MVIEVHRKVKNNVGDLYCNPSRYFDLGEVSSEEILNNQSNLKDNTLVIGGGGLIHKKFSKHIEALVDKNPKNSVIWGIGHNFGPKHVAKSNENVYYPKWLNKCDLVGIRDYINKELYLPCVSCMHDAFDKTYEVKHKYVYFTHAYKSNFTSSNYPHLKNNETDFYKVIEFLASGETVITNSYHGAYWGQLLGKNVQVVSWSVKFDHMKHQPLFLESIDSKPSLHKNLIDGFLDECRYLNNVFYQKYLNLK
jgi:hypothetical protein